MPQQQDRQYLELAAKLAIRAAGDVEPNPMVGAVIVKNDRIIGMGHHRKFGGLHAEREALADCRRRGESPRGSTIYVTLEPCCHHGKQPPCTDALIEAGVARVVAARPDPNPVSRGGVDVLRAAGASCDFDFSSTFATHLSDPFVRGILYGMPWVLAKWAQTPDGRLVTRPGEPRWISGDASRRRVHRIRARVDAIVTGIGTVLADDPRLTARGVRLHRIATRIVIDPELALPPDSALVRTAREVPVVAMCSDAAWEGSVARRKSLEAAGASVWPVPGGGRRLNLSAALNQVKAKIGATTVLLESGPGLLALAFKENLVDEVIAHIAGGLAPDQGLSAAALVTPALADSSRFDLCRARRAGDDVELHFRAAIASRTADWVAPSR